MAWSARELLEAAGYVIELQAGRWVRCKVARNEERWIGHGFDEDDAITHALAQMLPSDAAREMFVAALASPRPARGREAQAFSASADAAPASSTRETRGPSTPKRAPAPSVSPETESKALAELAALLHHIDHEEPRFALLAPDQQRLLVTLWISKARGHLEGAPSAAAEDLVEEVARRLNQLARAYHPGNVRSLQIAARPTDAAQTGQGAAKSWSEAAALVQKALDALIDAARAAGLDEHGWADTGAAGPPEGADAARNVAKTAFEEMEAVAASGATAELDERAVAKLVAAACRLRWVRSAGIEPLRWGRAMGKLRTLAAPLGAKAAPLREVIDARYRPEEPWPVLAQRAAGEGDKKPRVPLGEVPEGTGALGRWILENFKNADTAELVAVLRDRAADVLAIAEDDLPTRNPKALRRFRELRRGLTKAVDS